MLQGGAVGNVPEETLASYAQPLQTELPTWRPEFTEEVDEATRRRFGRGPTISPRKDRFDKVLDAIDGLFAGFANALTFGGSNYLRAAMWGQTATQNHQGIAYNIGMGVGVGVSFALGYGLGRGAAMGAWAAKGIRGYMIAGDVVGVAQSSYNAVTGQFSALDTLGFVPTIGWGMGAIGRYGGVRAPSRITGTSQSAGGFALNAGRARRSVDEAIELARAHGVHIPGDIEFLPAKLGEMPFGARAAYFDAKVSRSLAWGQLYNVRGKISVRIKSSQFLSDEALVTGIAHEMHELNALREIFKSSGGSLSARDLHLLVTKNARHPSGALGGSLHREAMDIEQRLLNQMRGR